MGKTKTQSRLCRKRQGRKGSSMTEIIGAPTLDDALAALACQVAEREACGEKNFIFCEDKLTLLAERAILERTGGTFLTEVSTFARFLAGERRMISKQGSVMALTSLMEERREELHCLGGGSAQAIYETVAQLSASRVSAQMLRESAEETEGMLRAKLLDLSLLSEAYGAFLAEKDLLDENGYLALLPEKIAAGALREYNVFFFAFPSFTAQARECVRAAIEGASAVTGIFLAGREDLYTNEAARVFRKTAEEFGEVRARMARCSLEGDALALRNGLFSPEKFALPPQPAASVRTFGAADETEEMNTVCALVKKYVAEGLRYRDIAVLVPDTESFTVTEKAFGAYRIPFFADKKRPFSEHPFCAFALAALEGAADGYLPETADTIAANICFGGGDGYRNYLLKYGGYRGAVTREIKDGDAVKGYDRAELVSCRERMLKIKSLFPRKGTGNAYCAGIRALSALVDESIWDQLKIYCTGEEGEFLDLSPLEGVLSETETVAGEKAFTAREFAVLFGNGLKALEISMLPQSADAVFVGDVTESRFPRAEVLICTGLSDALPRVSADTAVITDGEMGKLSSLSVEIEPAIAVVNARARESLALNLCSFRRALYLSCPARRRGAENAEGEILAYARKLFVLPPMPDLFPYDCSERSPAVLGLLALKADFEEGREDDGRKYNSLKAALTRAGEGQSVNALLTGMEKEKISSANELYFSSGASPTLLETYFSCPYAGFVSRGLRLREREERSLLDTDAGTFVHSVLEIAARRFGEIESEEECRRIADAAGRDLLATPRFASLTDTRAGAYTAERLVSEGASVSAAAYRQLVYSSFRIRQTEERISLPELNLFGKADRVDESDGYVRVIDYKTGAIDDSPISYYTGRKLQLQLYLLAASRGERAAGAFYFPAADDFANTGEEKFRMRGFFSKEEDVLSRMDGLRKEGEKSAFFEGGGRTGKGMTQDDFETFLEYARLVSARAKEEMTAGNIAPSPYEGACAYCKCKGMCGFIGSERRERGVDCGDIVKIVRRARGEEV